MSKFNLIELLNDNKATAQASLEKLGGDNDYFHGYLAAIEHAIQLAKIQQIRNENGLPL